MLRDWIRLIRPANAVTAGLGTALGYACIPGHYPWSQAGLGFVAMLFLAAAGNAHNDISDLEADRINRPDRALPAGLITRRTAVFTAAALYLAALTAAVAAGYSRGLLTLGMAALLYAYNYKLKALPLLGNLAVSILCALALYYPEFPGFPTHTWLPALFALLANLARELAKDTEDIAGDLAADRDTFPIRYGPDATRGVVGVLAVLVILLLPLPVFFLRYRPAYGVPAGLGALPLLLLIVYAMTIPATDWNQVQRRWKLVMLAGMAAIFVGVRGF
jgi:geranylgeranylglycerol-phosphate geranylgeranyltransferase